MASHAEIRVDLSAIGRNVRELVRIAGGAELCVVVKADGYGHGAIEVARAALDAGASRLAVAHVSEGIQLREAGIVAPILLLSEPPADALAGAWAHDLTPTLYHAETVAKAGQLVEASSATGPRPWPIHLKVDTGMHRVGARPDDMDEIVETVRDVPGLALEGLFTHLAVADEPSRPETAEQLVAFRRVVSQLAGHGIEPDYLHAANSAGLIAHPNARFDMVRVGIAVYGIAPGHRLEDLADLTPAMSVHSWVSHVNVVPAGEGVSYGLTHTFDVDTIVAVVPVGYADGIPRNYGSVGGSFLIGGVPRPVRGVVTMDQTVVEVGPVGHPSVVPVERGDEVVLIGTQGGADGVHSLTAWDWADLLDTIPYEIVCGFGPRLTRRHL